MKGKVIQKTDRYNKNKKTWGGTKHHGMRVIKNVRKVEEYGLPGEFVDVGEIVLKGKKAYVSRLPFSDTWSVIPESAYSVYRIEE